MRYVLMSDRLDDRYVTIKKLSKSIGVSDITLLHRLRCSSVPLFSFYNRDTGRFTQSRYYVRVADTDAARQILPCWSQEEDETRPLYCLEAAAWIHHTTVDRFTPDDWFEGEAFVFDRTAERQAPAAGTRRIDSKRLMALKESHPLVTDPRCFIFSWWPKELADD